jgi:hypothetical protein
MPCLGGMAQRSFGDRRALIDSRRAEAPSGIGVASMVGPVKGFALVFHSEDGLTGSGGGDFIRMRIIKTLSPNYAGESAFAVIGHKVQCLASCVCTS